MTLSTTWAMPLQVTMSVAMISGHTLFPLPAWDFSWFPSLSSSHFVIIKSSLLSPSNVSIFLSQKSFSSK
ncbi:unnamed protein product [Pseudo-nitzschia multistriata]|uniref:Uncharacterized protein n=1 Tax=Pseudo-nitzschia multistriata TaxID=183589 RepID=A0A448Z8N1_9STRA|nr:unnamed protein product [Pseudo-nitzschia multistriata]